MKQKKILFSVTKPIIGGVSKDIIEITQKLPNDVLDENRDLYKVGFFDESTNKIHVLK